MCDLDSLAAYNKVQKVRDKLRNELLHKKKASGDDLENSYPNQTVHCGNRPKNVAGQTLANETGYVNCGLVNSQKTWEHRCQ